MTDLQFMPFYWPDFLGDTMHLNGIESGVYAMLLGQMWLGHGWISSDDVAIARMCRIDVKVWNQMKPRIRPFLTLKDGRFSQKRLLDELRRAKKIRTATRKKMERIRKAKADKNQEHASVTGSVTEGITRARHPHPHTHTQGFPDGNPIPPGGGIARMRARPPKERTVNDVLNEMQGKDAADDEYYTFNASVERRDSGHSADIVQLHAISKDDGS